MRKFAFVVAALSVFFVISCDELLNAIDDTSPPDPVTGLSAVDEFDSVSLTWTKSFSSDVKNLEISWTGLDQPVVVSNDVTSYTVENLTPGVEYAFSIVVVDEANNRSSVAEESVAVGGFVASSIIYYENFNGSTWTDSDWEFTSGSPTPDLENGSLTISNGTRMYYKDVLGENSSVGLLLGIVSADTNGDGEVAISAVELTEPTAGIDVTGSEHEIVSFLSENGYFYRIEEGGAAAGGAINLTQIGTYVRSGAGTERVGFEWSSAGMDYFVDGVPEGSVAMADLTGGYWDVDKFSLAGGFTASFADGFRLLFNNWAPDSTQIDFVLVYVP